MDVNQFLTAVFPSKSDENIATPRFVKANVANVSYFSHKVSTIALLNH